MSKGLPRSLKRLYDTVLSGGGAPQAGTSKPQASYVRKETISFNNVVLPMVDAVGVVAHANMKIFDMPLGHILYLGSVIDLTAVKDAAGVSADWAGDVALGSVAEDGTVGPLDGAFVDLIPNTAVLEAAGVAPLKAESTATESGVHFDGSATAMDVFLNLLIDDTDHDVTGTPTNLILNGTITLIYVNLGDN